MLRLHADRSLRVTEPAKPIVTVTYFPRDYLGVRRIFRDTGFVLLGSDVGDYRRDLLSANRWLWGHETELPVNAVLLH